MPPSIGWSAITMENEYGVAVENAGAQNSLQLRWNSSWELDVSNNTLEGRFPLEMLLKHGTNWHTLDIAYTNITGSFPTGIESNFRLALLERDFDDVVPPLSEVLGSIKTAGFIPQSIHRLL